MEIVHVQFLKDMVNGLSTVIVLRGFSAILGVAFMLILSFAMTTIWVCAVSNIFGIPICYYSLGILSVFLGASNVLIAISKTLSRRVFEEYEEELPEIGIVKNNENT